MHIDQTAADLFAAQIDVINTAEGSKAEKDALQRRRTALAGLEPEQKASATVACRAMLRLLGDRPL